MHKGYDSRSVCVCVCVCLSVTVLAATYTSFIIIWIIINDKYIIIVNCPHKINSIMVP